MEDRDFVYVPDYMSGWKAAARMVESGFFWRECRGYALYAMRTRQDDSARGFFDAIMSGVGA